MKNWIAIRSLAFGKAVLFVFITVMMFACGSDERGAADLEHAIFMLGDRKKAEQRVIREQLIIRAQLKENSTQANSQGMRDKIAKDIQIVDLSIEKAKTNIANQDTIIFQLEQKLDSVNQVLNSAADKG